MCSDAEKRGSKKLKEFWKHGICPITGFNRTKSYIKIHSNREKKLDDSDKKTPCKKSRTKKIKNETNKKLNP